MFDMGSADNEVVGTEPAADMEPARKEAVAEVADILVADTADHIAAVVVDTAAVGTAAVHMAVALAAAVDTLAVDSDHAG